MYKLKYVPMPVFVLVRGGMADVWVYTMLKCNADSHSAVLCSGADTLKYTVWINSTVLQYIYNAWLLILALRPIEFILIAKCLLE
jgi:hypothetical protein